MAGALSNNISLKSLALKVLPAAAFVLLFLTFAQWVKQASPNRDDTKLKELQQLASEVPVPPGFSAVSVHSSSRGMDAGVYKTYRSAADYDEVKRFYSDALPARGWLPSKEKSHESLLVDTDGKDLEFQKGDMRIHIEYTGGTASSGSWNYSVNYLWDNHR